MLPSVFFPLLLGGFLEKQNAHSRGCFKVPLIFLVFSHGTQKYLLTSYHGLIIRGYRAFRSDQHINKQPWKPNPKQQSKERFKPVLGGSHIHNNHWFQFLWSLEEPVQFLNKFSFANFYTCPWFPKVWNQTGLRTLVLATLIFVRTMISSSWTNSLKNNFISDLGNWMVFIKPKRGIIEFQVDQLSP